MDTPLYDQWFRSYDHYNSGGGGGAAGNLLWTDQTVWTSLDFKPTSKGILWELLIPKS
jgi:hypothetical protein